MGNVKIRDLSILLGSGQPRRTLISENYLKGEIKGRAEGEVIGKKKQAQKMAISMLKKQRANR